ncbi:MAG: hypothetical protein V7607_1199 [Solirubrobacteraceae bacterium]
MNMEVTPRMIRALAAAVETRECRTHGNVAKALERRGLVVSHALELQGGTAIRPTDAGHELIASMGGPRQARQHEGNVGLALTDDEEPAQRWTLVVAVPAGLAPSDLTERIADEAGVTVVEVHFEDLVQRDEAEEK